MELLVCSTRWFFMLFVIFACHSCDGSKGIFGGKKGNGAGILLAALGGVGAGASALASGLLLGHGNRGGHGDYGGGHGGDHGSGGYGGGVQHLYGGSNGGVFVVRR